VPIAKGIGFPEEIRSVSIPLSSTIQSAVCGIRIPPVPVLRHNYPLGSRPCDRYADRASQLGNMVTNLRRTGLLFSQSMEQFSFGCNLEVE
jgi:hypothetical protein